MKKKILFYLIFTLFTHYTNSYCGQHLSIVLDNNNELHLEPNGSTQDANYTTSPTLAYANCPNFYDWILNNNNSNIAYRIMDIGIKNLEKIINKAIDREIQFYDTHFVLYHGQKREFLLTQDIYKKLYEKINKVRLRKFIFLRIPNDEFDEYKNMTKFLRRNDPYQYGFDNDPYINKHILSVNASLFGNSLYTINKYISECTFKYFVRSQNITSMDFLDLCEDAFETLQINSLFYNYTTDLIDLISLLSNYEKEKTGILLQIFIPKEKINNITYRAKVQGNPFYQTSIMQFDTSSAISEYTNTLIRMQNNRSFYNNYFANMFDIDELQFRLLLTNDVILNPNSGVNIFRYTNITPNLTSYKQKLSILINKIIKDLEELNLTTSINN